MKKQIFLAGMMFVAAPVFADTAPDICLNVANYAAQSLDQRFSDGTWGDRHNPRRLRLTSDFVHFPVTNVKDLGSCDDLNTPIKENWCRIAGGPAEVYQIEVSRTDSGATPAPFADVVVTFNRGGCRVSAAELR